MTENRNVLEIYEKIEFNEDYIPQCKSKDLDPNDISNISRYITDFLGEINVNQDDILPIAQHHLEILKLTTTKEIEEYKQKHLNYDIPVGTTVFWTD